MSTDDKVKRLAEEHVDWLISCIVPIIRRVGVDEFTHGYKHGQDDMKKEKINNDNKTNG